MRLGDELQYVSLRPASSGSSGVCFHKPAVSSPREDWDVVLHWKRPRISWGIRRDSRGGGAQAVFHIGKSLSVSTPPCSESRLFQSASYISGGIYWGKNMQLNAVFWVQDSFALRPIITQPLRTHTDRVKEVWKPTVLDGVIGPICALAARHMSPWLRVSSCHDVRKRRWWRLTRPNRSRKLRPLAPVCVCVARLAFGGVRWWSVFPLTARGTPHLFNVAFTAPPVCLRRGKQKLSASVSCVCTSTPYKARSSHSCGHKRTFRCASCHTSYIIN